MLHIGNKSINLAVKNAGVLYVGSRKMGPIIPSEESSVDNFVTQSGDTIVTSDGTPLTLDNISSLTAAPSITDSQLTFADDDNSTVSFSMQQLKDYVSGGSAGQL